MRNHPTQTHLGAAGGGEQKAGLKARAIDELTKFLLMTAYLWLILALLSLHKGTVLAEQGINYEEQGFAIVNALVLAKVMLVAEDLKMGTRLNDHPLIYSVLYKSFTFAVLLICFHIGERTAVALLHGRAISDTLANAAARNMSEVLAMGAIVFVALTPFFVYWELTRLLGSDQFLQLVFTRRGRRKLTLQVQE